MPYRVISLCLLLLVTPLLAAQTRQPVLMISIDGMRPDYVTQADAHGLRLPNLRRMLAEGTRAEGVQGVYPTVTYPSHTTLVTGVSPAEQGILNNQIFDPERRMHDSWYWYNRQIKVAMSEDHTGDITVRPLHAKLMIVRKVSARMLNSARKPILFGTTEADGTSRIVPILGER